MAFEIPIALVGDLRLAARRAAGVADGDAEGDAPPLLSVAVSVAELAFSSSSGSAVVLCDRCGARLLHGVRSATCAFCGSRSSAAPEVSFASMSACRWLLGSLGLDGSEPINFDTEPADSSKGSSKGGDTPKSRIILSDLLDVKLKWMAQQEEVSQGTIPKLSTSSQEVSLSGVDLDQMFVVHKDDLPRDPEISSDDYLVSKNDKLNDKGHQASESVFDLSKRHYSSEVRGSSQNTNITEDTNSFADWKADFQPVSPGEIIGGNRQDNLFQSSLASQSVSFQNAPSLSFDTVATEVEGNYRSKGNLPIAGNLQDDIWFDNNTLLESTQISENDSASINKSLDGKNWVDADPWVIINNVSGNTAKEYGEFETTLENWQEVTAENESNNDEYNIANQMNSAAVSSLETALEDWQEFTPAKSSVYSDDPIPGQPTNGAADGLLGVTEEELQSFTLANGNVDELNSQEDNNYAVLSVESTIDDWLEFTAVKGTSDYTPDPPKPFRARQEWGEFDGANQNVFGRSNVPESTSSAVLGSLQISFEDWDDGHDDPHILKHANSAAVGSAETILEEWQESTAVNLNRDDAVKFPQETTEDWQEFTAANSNGFAVSDIPKKANSDAIGFSVATSEDWQEFPTTVNSKGGDDAFQFQTQDNSAPASSCRTALEEWPEPSTSNVNYDGVINLSEQAISAAVGSSGTMLEEQFTPSHVSHEGISNLGDQTNSATVGSVGEELEEWGEFAVAHAGFVSLQTTQDDWQNFPAANGNLNDVSNPPKQIISAAVGLSGTVHWQGFPAANASDGRESDHPKQTNFTSIFSLGTTFEPWAELSFTKGYSDDATSILKQTNSTVVSSFRTTSEPFPQFSFSNGTYDDASSAEKQTNSATADPLETILDWSNFTNANEGHDHVLNTPKLTSSVAAVSGGTMPADSWFSGSTTTGQTVAEQINSATAAAAGDPLQTILDWSKFTVSNGGHNDVSSLPKHGTSVSVSSSGTMPLDSWFVGNTAATSHTEVGNGNSGQELESSVNGTKNLWPANKKEDFDFGFIVKVNDSGKADNSLSNPSGIVAGTLFEHHPEVVSTDPFLQPGTKESGSSPQVDDIDDLFSDWPVITSSSQPHVTNRNTETLVKDVTAERPPESAAPSLWPTHLTSEHKNNESLEESVDDFDEWQDFAGSSFAEGSLSSSTTQNTLPAFENNVTAHPTEEDEFGSFMDALSSPQSSRSIGNSLDRNFLWAARSNRADVMNQTTEADLFSSILMGMPSAKSVGKASNSDRTSEKLWSQVHDLSHTLEDQLKVPNKQSKPLS